MVMTRLTLVLSLKGAVQILIVLSAEQLAMCRPVGEMATPFTHFECDCRVPEYSRQAESERRWGDGTFAMQKHV